MIKNYVVGIRSVKAERLGTFINYLNSTTHKNHTKHNTEISEYSDRESFEALYADRLWKNAEAFIKRARGGRRLKVIGKSLTFNIPPQFEFNKEIANDLSEDIINGLKKIYNSFGYELEENEIYYVLHNQRNPHFHFIVPYLDKSGTPLKDVKTKKFLSELKLLWNEVMINAYQIKLEEYKPLNEGNKNINMNRQFLEELKAYYEKEFENEKYVNGQIKRVKRLLKLSDDLLKEKASDIESLDINLEKVLKKHKKSNGPIMTKTKD